MDNEKLLKERNEKLALWSGFEFEKNTTPSGGIYYNRICDPNSKVCKMPDFSKVDDCITWLLPRVDGLEGVLFWPTTEGYWWSMSVIDIPFEGDTLAEAIEKYVDWQSEDDNDL